MYESLQHKLDTHSSASFRDFRGEQKLPKWGFFRFERAGFKTLGSLGPGTYVYIYIYISTPPGWQQKKTSSWAVCSLSVSPSRDWCRFA